MSKLLLDVRANGQWKRMGAVLLGSQSGSLSHNGPAGRQMYLFKCHTDHAVIERSTGGADYEVGYERAIQSIGLEKVARLDAENPDFECWLKTDHSTEPHRMRFRFLP